MHRSRLRSRFFGAGGGIVPIENPRIALVGDSLTQFNNLTVNISGITLSRAADGVVTVPKAAHGIVGTPNTYVINAGDPSFQVLAPVTVIDANNFSYPTNVLSAATTSNSNCYASIQNRFTLSGQWAWAQSEHNGGLTFVGNFGQSGYFANQMNGATQSASDSAADIVVIAAGINDVNAAGQSGAGITAEVQALVDIVLAAGKRCILLGITPLGSGIATNTKNTNTLDANAGFAAIAAANPGAVVFANPHPLLVDTGATQFTTGQAWSWVTYDNIHWTQRAARVIGGVLADAITSMCTVGTLLPTASGELPTLAGWTAIKQYGSWTGAGGGVNGTGNSGTVAPLFDLHTTSAATTSANTLVARGAGEGYWQRCVITPGGTNHNQTCYLENTSGETLAALGLTTSDTVKVVVEYQYSGGAASNFIGLQLDCNSQSTGTYGYGRVGGYTSVGYVDDAASGVLVTGEFKLTSAITHISTQLGARFAAASASPLTLDIGRVILYKKN